MNTVAGTPGTRASRSLLAAALLALAASLVWRIAYRGFFYVGWETLGGAQGRYLLATRGVLGAFKEVWASTRNYGLYWSPVNSLVYTMIPGSLGALLPWEYWAHLLSFVLCVVTFVVLARALEVPRALLPLFLLGIGSSAIVLSFALVGYAYISGMLPHALAIAITQSERCRRSWPRSLVLALLTTELSWHLHPLGKTHCVVFLAGACLIRGVPARTRVVWALVGVLQLAQIRAYEMQTIVGVGAGDSMKFVRQVGDFIYPLIHALYLSSDLDIPVLAVAGVIGFALVDRDPCFFRAIYLAQLVPLFTITGEAGLPARRLIVFQFYNLVMLGLWLRGLGAQVDARRERRIAFAVVALGSVLQMVDLWRFTRTPIAENNRALPHTQCANDNFILPPLIAASRNLLALVAEGKKLVLVYNYETYQENATDPTGVPERLYNYLGHRRFVDAIRIFGNLRCRYSCVPITPLAEVDAAVASLGAWGDVVVATFGGTMSNQFNAERKLIMDTLAMHYELVPLEHFVADPPAEFTLYALRAKEGS